MSKTISLSMNKEAEKRWNNLNNIINRFGDMGDSNVFRVILRYAEIKVQLEEAQKELYEESKKESSK